MVLHVVYGLRLAANTTIPGFPLSPTADAFDVSLRLGEWGKFSWKTSKLIDIPDCFQDPPVGHPNLHVDELLDGSYIGLFYGDGVRFAVERCGREVWADWPENCTLEDACTYLVGPVIGFVLRLRGTVCLHASAVAVSGRAIALVGPPGSGKSTTAAAFARAGFSVVSDDVVALANKGGQFLVQPGYPRVNLWPDSVLRLFGSEHVLPCIAPTWDKRYLPLGENGHHFASSPLQLGAIYILEGRDSALSAPAIEDVSGKEAFMTLVANTYVNYLLDRDMRRKEFDVLSHVVSGIPVRRVRPPDDPSAILDLCSSIAADARRVMAAAPANATSVLG